MLNAHRESIDYRIVNKEKFRPKPSLSFETLFGILSTQRNCLEELVEKESALHTHTYSYIALVHGQCLFAVANPLIPLLPLIAQLPQTGCEFANKSIGKLLCIGPFVTMLNGLARGVVPQIAKY